MSSVEKTKYSAEELKEFEELLLHKVTQAKKEKETYVNAMSKRNDSGTTSTTGDKHSLENGSESLEKERLSQLAGRQDKFIINCENALVRIKNGTYGLCSVTGKLIPKERLRAVPHTTMTVEAKNEQK